MLESAYRVVVTYDKSRDMYNAKIPELDPCFADGKTRQEALAALEVELTDRLHNMKEKGVVAPTPIDEKEFKDPMVVSLSYSLRKELAWLAMNEGISVDSLVTELVTYALAKKGQEFGRTKNLQGQSHQSNKRPDGESRRNGRYPADGRNRSLQSRHAGPYHDLLNDRANFIQYVRETEGPSQGDLGHRSDKNRYDNSHRRKPHSKMHRHKKRPQSDAGQTVSSSVDSRIEQSAPLTDQEKNKTD